MFPGAKGEFVRKLWLNGLSEAMLEWSASMATIRPRLGECIFRKRTSVNRAQMNVGTSIPSRMSVLDGTYRARRYVLC